MGEARKTFLMVSLVVAGACAQAMTDGKGWENLLPRPIYDAKPELVSFYEKAWTLAHGRIDELPGLPASRYMDEAHMSNRIWIWDTCFMVHFCKYCPQEFPGIESLENFYGVVLADASKPLPKVRGNVWCGAHEGKMLNFRIHHPDNPPLFAWTEYAYALQTGDRSRLEKVYRTNRWLQRWHMLFDSFDPKAPQPYGTAEKVMLKKVPDGYRWGGCPSGMDNTPRGRTGKDDRGNETDCPNNPDLLWVDALAQQGLSALSLSRIADLLGDAAGVKEWRQRFDEIKSQLNRLYWDEQDGFYYDISESTGKKVKVPTAASYWPLLAEAASPAQAKRMLALLTDDRKFGGPMPVPSLSRDDPDFHADGSYWRGSMWMPTAYMAVKAADAYGDYATARDVSRKIVEMMYRTYVEFEPHTIWECYSPTEAKPATNKQKQYVRYDFCGWSALGPISLFIEDVIGVKQANAFANTLTCDFEKNPKGRVGVENYRFGKVVCSIVATTGEITVDANLPFTLKADGRDFAVKTGHNVFSRKDKIVFVPAHPDDMTACLGFAHLARDVFDLHVIDYTHGERGCGKEKFDSGWTKAKRTQEEQAVCDSIGARLHWLDEVDGEAYANRESCERLAALLKEIQPRAVFAHWPVDVHTDHVMAGAATLRAIFLAGIKPEVYFFEETYQAKRFVPDVFVDISSVYDKVWQSLRLYECQYRDGTMERRRKASADFYGWHSAKYYGGKSEGYMSFVQPMQGEKTVFAELPKPYPKERGINFQGAK